ncbi:MAG TPA: adenylate/guanylate cyclase domain-containing protein [Acidobacteriota bacterium]|jgi:class 3 adenylate cyclase|nr:adenylate/guanylate cyclase domain-containing protein [Acidobacteriota bacterium]
MSIFINTSLAITIVLCTAFFIVFFIAVRLRWFAKLKHGFLITMMLALVGAGLAASLIGGVWGYEAARQVLKQQIVADLANVGEIVESQVQIDIKTALDQMGHLARVFGPKIGKSTASQLVEKFRETQELNPRLLQLRITDAQSNTLAERSVTGVIDPMNRVAAAVSLEGGAFASDPFISPAFKEYVLNLSVPVRSLQNRTIAALSARYDLQGDVLELIQTTKFNVSGYAVIVNYDGRILAHPDVKRVNEDISSYPAVQLGLQNQTGSLVAKNKAGQERLMFYRPVRSPATINPKPLMLMTEISQAEAEATLRSLRARFLIMVIVLAVACLVGSQQISVYVQRPVRELMHVAARIQQGDLNTEAHGMGKDEIGQLGTALNNMVHGLQERERVKAVFGQYVATQVSEKVLKGEINLGGESRNVTILFSDIRNFTSMSEQMTPTQVVGFLNEYFSEMVEAVFAEGGVLDKFIGDGMMAVFGSFEDTPDHAQRAVRASLRMKALLAKINGERSMQGKPPIGIGIGIHTDEVIVGNIGSAKRLQYTAIGDGVNTCSRVESLNKEFGTTILITENTYQLVKDQFECRQMPEAHLKGKSKPLQFYEVLSVKAA